jgi:AraC-like DNA-binding protein
MTANIILLNITCVSFFLLAFIAFFNPLKVNVIANKWFGIFLFSAGSAVLDIIIYETKTMDSYRQLIAFNELSRFAMMPALYLSVLHYTSAGKVLRKKEYLHFLPFLIFFVCTASFVFKPNSFIFNPDVFPAVFKMTLEVFIKAAIPTQLVVYWLLSYYKLSGHQKNIQLVTSNTDPVNLNWLRLLLFGVLFIILISIVDRFSGNQLLKIYSPLGYLAGTLFLAYFLLAQKEVYPYETPELESINAIINPEQKTTASKPRFSEDTLVLLKTRVINLMESERLFLDNELGLPELAKEMAVSPHDLSYLLNEGFGLNFFQFINGYRVNEAKQLMLSGKYRHLNILGIAYNAGFNSKTTFNTAFKKETGLSPSQFIQQTRSATSLPLLQ